jgi:hypothetical protein
VPSLHHDNDVLRVVLLRVRGGHSVVCPSVYLIQLTGNTHDMSILIIINNTHRSQHRYDGQQRHDELSSSCVCCRSYVVSVCRLI